MAKKPELNLSLVFTIIFISTALSTGIVFSALSIFLNKDKTPEVNNLVDNLDEEIEKGIDRYIAKQEEKHRKEQAKMAEEQQEQEESAKKNLTKNDQPVVELFVMSHCPFGTQIEKGILPVVETLGDNIDFSIKFCDYAMHDKQEIDEQLRQHCIQEKENDKFLSYLKCFLEKGESNNCLQKTNINTDLLNSCVSETDAKFKITENYENKIGWKGRFPSFNISAEENEKYGVQGSPSLVINGTLIPSARDAKSLLETICLGFKNQPTECQADLSSAPPAPGFGFDGTGSNTDASCG